MQGIKHLDRMDWAMYLFAITTLVAFVLTIVLIGLSQANYVSALAPLSSFSGSIGMIIVMAVLHNCQDCVAKRHKIDLCEYYKSRQPMPKEKADERT